MPAKPKIYERCDRPGAWYVRLGGKPKLLSRESYADACRQYAAMTGDASFVARVVQANGTDGRVTIFEVVDRYLASLVESSAPKTVEFNRQWLESFVEFVGPRTPVDAIEPHRIDDWIKANKRWNGTSGSHAVSSLRAAIAWAGRKRYYRGENPAEFADRPQRSKSPTIALTPEQQRKLVKVAPSLGKPFAEAVTFMLLTGVRPQELRAIEAQHVNLDKSVVHWPAGEAPKGSNARTVYLSGDSLVMIRRLLKAHPVGPLFRTARGKPWTKDGLDTLFWKLRDKLPIEGLNPRCLRKTFATNCAAAGLPREHTQELMGHSDHRMLDDVYLHLESRPEIHRSANVVFRQHAALVRPNAKSRRGSR